MFNGPSLEIKPLEVTDFSGGMTDYFLGGDSKRYQKADNFWINVDKQLEVRWGSRGFDEEGNHLLDRRQRVDAFLFFDEERELLVAQGRDVFYMDSTPAWTRLTGPSGNEALSAGGPYQAISSTENKDHLYLASEGFGIPSKIYKDTAGDYQVRTLGLPSPTAIAPMNESVLLAMCLRLANEIRSSMISHMRDHANTDPVGGKIRGYLHNLPDKYSLYYIDEVQTFLASGAPTFSGADLYYPGPSPAPTPAPAATDEATLYTLVQALSYAYNHHGYDPVNGAAGYHSFAYYDTNQFVPTSGLGPYEKVATTLPETLEAAASRLNELRRKWYWHQLSPWIHDVLNEHSRINKYRVQAPAIPTIDYEGKLVVQANYADYFRYVNYLKHGYNLHTTNMRIGADFYPYTVGPGSFYVFHTGPVGIRNWPSGPNYPIYPSFPIHVTLPDCNDLDSAALLITWVGLLYGTMHYPDGNIATHTNFWADTTADSANLTDVSSTAGGTDITIPVTPKFQTVIGSAGLFKSNISADSDSDLVYWGGRATTVGSGTATLTIGPSTTSAARFLSSTVQDSPMQYSASYLHGSWTQGSAAGSATLATRTTSPALSGEAMSEDTLEGLAIRTSALPQTTAEWIEVAEEIFTCLNVHAGNGVSHYMPFDLGGYFQGTRVPNAYPSITQIASLLFYSGQGPFFKPEIASYVYAAAYKHEYTTESGVEYAVVSEPMFTEAIETGKIYPVGSTRPSGIDGIPDGKVETVYGPTITNIPELENSHNTNYGTDEVMVQIYRTIDAGNTYYLVDEFENGAETSYTDLAPDTESGGGLDSLDSREELYTTGGVEANVQPPACKYLHVVNDIAYYGYILDDGQIFKNRVVQSIPGTPDGAPLDFYVDLEDELMGISSARKKPIAFSKTKVERIEGSFDERGQGFLKGESISDEIGCISSASIVTTEVGVFFAGNDGFYYTDAFQIIKISLDINETFKAITATEDQQRRIYGTYDRDNRRVMWTAQTQKFDSDCDVVFCYYLDYGVKPSGSFTTMSNGDHFRPTALAFWKGFMIRGDERGLIFKHAPYFLSDPAVPEDPTVDALEDWQLVHIPYDYRSCALDFGTIYKGQYVTKIHFMGENQGNFNLEIYSIADNRRSRNEKPLSPVRYADNPTWGDPMIDWADASLDWGAEGKADYWRRFPNGTLRSQLKQVGFRPARIGVYRYDDYPEGSYVVVDPATGTATLTIPEGYTDLVFPSDVVGMYVAFDNDNYTREWVIISAEDNVLTLAETVEIPIEDEAPDEVPAPPPADPPEVPTGSIEMPVRFWRPIPQPHEPWVPVYTTVFSYKMAKGEIVPLWFRVRTATTVTLALGGDDAGSFTAEFFKPFAMNLNGTHAYLRPTLASSPLAAYYDALNPIPAGADNFTPEVPGEYEYVYMVLTCDPAATDGNKSIQIDFGGDTIPAQIRVWGGIALPSVPTQQLAVLAGGVYAGNGTQYNYTTDANQATAVKASEDLLIKYRMTPYGSPTSFLATSGATYNVDQNSGSGGSFRQTIIDKLGAATGYYKFWFCSPSTNGTHRTLAYAQAAEATIAAESLSNMWVYIWDEPGTDLTTVTNLKAALDAWSAGSPSTMILLTTYKDYDQGANAQSVGLDFSSYSNLVLVPVIQQLNTGGAFNPIGDYTNDRAGFYTSCQGMCRARTNGANTNTGIDQLEVDLAVVDLPMVRRYAAYGLAQRTNWREKIATMLYYNAMESWSDLNPGGLTNPAQNSWLSARRFGVQGDGTLIYPATQNYKPHVGLAAFGASSLASVPSIRLLYLAHASRMIDLFELYRVAQSHNVADLLVTDQDTFETDYDRWELMRQQIGDALNASTAANFTTTIIGTGITSPEDLEEDVSPNDPEEPEEPVDPGDTTTGVADVELPELAAAKWVIRGYMKEAKIAPVAYALHFAQFGERGRAYTADDRGENAESES